MLNGASRLISFRALRVSIYALQNCSHFFLLMPSTSETRDGS